MGCRSKQRFSIKESEISKKHLNKCSTFQWEQPKYPTLKNKNTFPQCNSSVKSNDIMTFSGKWMELEKSIMDNVSQTEKLHSMHSYIDDY